MWLFIYIMHTFSNLKNAFCERDRIYNIYDMTSRKISVDFLDLGPIQLLKGIRAIMKQGPTADTYLANFDGN